MKQIILRALVGAILLGNVHQIFGQQIETLAIRPYRCWAIALDATNVYWTEPGNGIMKVPKTGGAVVTLASGTNSAFAIAVYGNYVYWAERNGDGYGAIKMTPINGGTVTTVASDNTMGAGNGIRGLVVDSSGIYWVVSGSRNWENDGSIRKLGGVPVDNPILLSITAPITLATNLPNPTGLASDENYIYWIEHNWTIAGSGAVKRVPKGGGSISVLVTGLGEVSGIAVDNTNTYFGIWNGSVYRVPKSGGTASIVGGAVSSDFLALDDKNVYSASVWSSGQIWKTPKAGGGGTTWSSGGNGSWGVAADQSGVYWTECPTCIPAGGFIRVVRNVTPENLGQFKSDETTEIPIGGTTNEPTVIFKANVSDPDGDRVKLQIELRRLDEYNGQFLNEFTQESDFVNIGSGVTVPAYGLINGNYHWQARTVDETDACSPWIQFGSNDISQPDFTVATLPQTKFLTLPFKDPDIMVGWIFDDTDPNVHYGIDFIKGWQPFTIIASAEGDAMYKGYFPKKADGSPNYGHLVMMRHPYYDTAGNQFYTLYAHLNTVSEKFPKDVWVPVRRGENIGQAGESGAEGTGIHLHFEVQAGESLQAGRQNRIDPYGLYEDRDSHYGEKAASIKCGPNYLWTSSPPTSADRIIAKVHSPVELMVYDSQGRIAGLQNGQEKTDIPYSTYSEGTVTIFFPSDTYRYEIVGTDEGTYGLDITSVEDGNTITFDANNIPTSPNATHQYTIDWQALSQGQKGVTIDIDTDGDGVFENTVIADGELTHDEFIIQTETAIDFDPDTLNLKSKGQFVTVYIELPSGFDANQIEISSILLNDSVPALSKPVAIGDHDKNGTADLMVKFERNKVQSIIGTGGKALINITGKVLHDGSRLDFKGDDTIKILR